MDELKKVDHWKARLPTPDAKCGLVLSVVIKRERAGKVYVDDLGDPHMMLLAGPGLKR